VAAEAAPQKHAGNCNLVFRRARFRKVIFAVKRYASTFLNKAE
jgi:hypothetical protein